MFVLIVGGGRIGAHLTAELVDSGHRVTLVEKDPDRCERLRQELKTTVVCGDGNDPLVLQEAGVRAAEALAAVTGEDEDNLVISLLGKREFAVRRVVARINNPRNAWLFTPIMGVDTAVHPAQVIAKLIEEEVTLGEIVTLLKLRQGEVTLVELTVAAESPVVGHRLGDIDLPANTTVVAVLRDNRVLVPVPELRFQPEDRVLALAQVEAEVALVQRLRGPQ